MAEKARQASSKCAALRPTALPRVCLAAVWILLGACAPAPGARSTPSPQSATSLPPTETLPAAPAVESFDDLIASLRAAGLEPKVVGDAPSGHFDAPGVSLRAGSSEIWVFEFPSQEVQAERASRISPDGSDMAGWPGRPHMWASGRLIVVYAGTDGGTVLSLSGLLGDPITRPADVEDEPYPPAVAAAVGWVAQRRGVDPASIEVEAYQPAVWPDSCLGLGEGEEVCERGDTPGWRVILRWGERQTLVRTDEFGAQIREEAP